METITREIHPNLEKRYSTFLGDDLEKFLIRLEKQFEPKLIELLKQVDVHASVKTDRTSLPYQDEIIIKMQNESYIPGMYEFVRLARPVVYTMLDKGATKIRFYLHIETFGGDKEGLIGYLQSGLKYSFRYYIH